MPARSLISSMTTPLRRLAARVGGACLVCRSGCVGGFCDDCLARFALPVHRCDGCALGVPAGQARCGACLLAPPLQRRSLAALHYAFPWDGLVQRFKYREAPELALPLVGRLQAAVQAAGPLGADLLVPVPVSAAKLRERGYNQAWELARRLGPRLGVPAEARALQRLLDGPSQQGGSRAERRAQVRDAFAVPRAAAPRLAGRHVALVDDVMTTGATAEAATAALLRGGAASVQVWVLARTPAALH
jgi:ComF family protein